MKKHGCFPVRFLSLTSTLSSTVRSKSELSNCFPQSDSCVHLTIFSVIYPQTFVFICK